LRRERDSNQTLELCGSNGFTELLFFGIRIGILLNVFSQDFLLLFRSLGCKGNISVAVAKLLQKYFCNDATMHSPVI
jgi:hypothetical protein